MENIFEADANELEIAMSIIMQAGDARLAGNECLIAIQKNDYVLANEKLAEARKKLADAHAKQTELIQSEGESGEVKQHSLLFIHAQDTLMTINTELNIARNLIKICEGIDVRLRALEGAE